MGASDHDFDLGPRFSREFMDFIIGELSGSGGVVLHSSVLTFVGRVAAELV